MFTYESERGNFALTKVREKDRLGRYLLQKIPELLLSMCMVSSHRVENFRTIQSAENWREKIQINQSKTSIFSTRRKFETNQLKSRKFEFLARK